MSERPAYGLLAGLALGLLPAELDQSIFAPHCQQLSLNSAVCPDWL